MSITVVTTRGDEGAPATREVYADAVKYRVGDSNLELYSAQSQLIAYYGSGNWLSVYEDEPFELRSGPPDPALHMTTVPPRAPTSERRAPDADRSASPQGQAPSDGPDTVARPPLPRTTMPARRPDLGPEPAPAEPAPAPLSPSAASAEMRARSPHMRRVTFRTKTYRAARPGATPPAPATTRSGTTMRPVVFRPRVYRAAAEAAAQAEAAVDIGPDDVVEHAPDDDTAGPVGES